MDAYYPRLSKDEVYASWQGLTFTLREWLGEEEDVPHAHERRRKPMLKA
jgi:hypothetical protein